MDNIREMLYYTKYNYFEEWTREHGHDIGYLLDDL